MQVFLKIIGRLLRNMEKSIYVPVLINLQAEEFAAKALQTFAVEYKKIRITVIRAILNSVKEFTVKSINWRTYSRCPFPGSLRTTSLRSLSRTASPSSYISKQKRSQLTSGSLFSSIIASNKISKAQRLIV